MTRRERADKIEAIVGAKRDAVLHIGRAVSAEQRVYILHSVACVATGRDLRNCEYSEALDDGIDLEIWGPLQDRPVIVDIDEEVLDLVPRRFQPEPRDRAVWHLPVADVLIGHEHLHLDAPISGDHRPDKNRSQL